MGKKGELRKIQLQRKERGIKYKYKIKREEFLDWVTIEKKLCILRTNIDRLECKEQNIFKDCMTIVNDWDLQS